MTSLPDPGCAEASASQVGRPATKRFHTSNWRSLETCCRQRTWWCNDATALVGYVKLMMMMIRKPVEVSEERSDVVVVLRANCQACGSADDGLQTVQVAAGQAGETDVAVV